MRIPVSIVINAAEYAFFLLQKELVDAGGKKGLFISVACHNMHRVDMSFHPQPCKQFTTGLATYEPSDGNSEKNQSYQAACYALYHKCDTDSMLQKDPASAFITPHIKIALGGHSTPNGMFAVGIRGCLEAENSQLAKVFLSAMETFLTRVLHYCVTEGRKPDEGAVSDMLLKSQRRLNSSSKRIVPEQHVWEKLPERPVSLGAN